MAAKTKQPAAIEPRKTGIAVFYDLTDDNQLFEACREWGYLGQGDLNENLAIVAFNPERTSNFLAGLRAASDDASRRLFNADVLALCNNALALGASVVVVEQNVNDVFLSGL